MTIVGRVPPGQVLIWLLSADVLLIRKALGVVLDPLRILEIRL